MFYEDRKPKELPWRLWMSGQDGWSGLTLTDEVCSLSFLQLFRRVAAALPGMESTQDKSREDSILTLHRNVCVTDYACFSVAIVETDCTQTFTATYWVACKPIKTY